MGKFMHSQTKKNVTNLASQYEVVVMTKHKTDRDSTMRGKLEM